MIRREKTDEVIINTREDVFSIVAKIKKFREERGEVEKLELISKFVKGIKTKVEEKIANNPYDDFYMVKYGSMDEDYYTIINLVKNNKDLIDDICDEIREKMEVKIKVKIETCILVSFEFK